MLERIGVPVLVTLLALAGAGCSGPSSTSPGGTSGAPGSPCAGKYATVRLTADLSGLSDAQRRMIPLLIEAARQMDDVFWQEAYGDRDELLSSIDDPELRRCVEINYGPWDRLNGNEPMLPGIGPKPPGARFYPDDMTREEFEQAVAAADEKTAAALKSLYTLVGRAEDGSLQPVPYHVAFHDQHAAAAAKLREAAKLAEAEGLRRYLEARAAALESDDYHDSDVAWLDMRDNVIDIVIGPIETYEDELFGYKAAHEAYVLLRDRAWNERLARYAQFLPKLQRSLPVPDAYKSETPGTDADLGAYDVIYYAGHSNAGSKTIAINLPNDEEIQLEKGTRRLQLRNAMRAKFDRILVPIAEQLVAPEQRGHVSFDAFFANTMFHEVAHGLGIKHTIDGKRTVREALKEEASALEEGKADVLGLYMLMQLHDWGEVEEPPLEDSFVTFMASIFRSIRFGASSAHGRANLLRFNFFMEKGAFARDPETGTYRVDFDKMREAVDALSAKILTLQGDGDLAAAKAFADRYETIGPDLRADLDRLAAAGIPVDIVFEQGEDVLGL
ncbi:MAG: Zn-dependent hydrolase [Acidobacteria bacterium]|nr:MAG: Zn-dependent hydrolase [Acidobacteriota bacterium]